MTFNKFIFINFSLQFLTILFIFFVLIPKQVNHQKSDITLDTGRNERSTPRSFVLPSTPAVADIQVEKKKLLKEKESILKCIYFLEKVSGKKLKNNDDIFDFRIKLAILEFQKEKNLNLSLQFDSETRKLLQCLS